MLTTPIGKDLATSHWGAYDVVRQDGEVVGLAGRSDDPDPSPIGPAMWDAYRSPLRIQKPAVRKGWLERQGGEATGSGRGKDPFFKVSWGNALGPGAGWGHEPAGGSGEASGDVLPAERPRRGLA